MHKSHGEGLLQINLSRTGNSLQCVIEDNGVGREAARLIKSKSAERNKSMGMQITRDRMDITGRTADLTFEVEIEDLFDAKGFAAGTRVVVRMTEK